LKSVLHQCSEQKPYDLGRSGIRGISPDHWRNTCNR
jgi:hypothetical protein